MNALCLNFCVQICSIDLFFFFFLSAGTYTIFAKRALGDAGNSQIALLESLELSDRHVLQPKFDSDIENYSANVAEDITSMFVRAKAVDKDGVPTVIVQGSAEANGARSRRLDLLPGPNKIYVVVQAPNRVSTKTYTITVTRKYKRPSALASPAAVLDKLIPSLDLGLNPLFDPVSLQCLFEV
jgi:hypothetical protein